MCRELTGEQRTLLKGTRFLLLKGLENLKAPGLDRLSALEGLNQPLFQAYLLKEELRQFWNMPDRETGDAFLDAWVDEARATGLKHFTKLAQTVQQHRDQLTASAIWSTLNFDCISFMRISRHFPDDPLFSRPRGALKIL